MSTKKLQVIGSIWGTDSTLTQSGVAADAKAAGDLIGNLSNLIGDEPVSDQINSAIDLSCAQKPITYTATFLASGWSGDAPYSQTVTCSGLLAEDNPWVDVDMSGASSNEIVEAWTQIGRVTVLANNEITAYCYEEKPSINVPIIIKVVR